MLVSVMIVIHRLIREDSDQAGTSYRAFAS